MPLSDEILLQPTDKSLYLGQRAGPPTQPDYQCLHRLNTQEVTTALKLDLGIGEHRRLKL
jgi:hypothetical protein